MIRRLYYIFILFLFFIFLRRNSHRSPYKSNSTKRCPVRSKQNQRNKKIICSYFFKLKKAKEKKTGVRVRRNIIYPFLQFFRMWRHQ